MVACAELFDPVAALLALKQVLFQLPGLAVGEFAQQELFQFYRRRTRSGHFPFPAPRILAALMFPFSGIPAPERIPAAVRLLRGYTYRRRRTFHPAAKKIPDSVEQPVEFLP